MKYNFKQYVYLTVMCDNYIHTYVEVFRFRNIIVTRNGDVTYVPGTTL